MFARIVTTRSKSKTYRYAQLVESYRRKDGMPVHRVIANLGRVDDDTLVDNLNKALQAAKSGEGLVAPMTAGPESMAKRPVANLRYLDVAVVIDLLRHWGVVELLQRYLDGDEAEVAASKVVLALVAQRCVEPDSKLEASRWFPRTALPELLSVDPAQFNNTRIHRVLDALDGATGQLMLALSQRCAERQQKPFAMLFLDTTDTWFVGHGPAELAQRGKVKEGRVEQKIGIVLLCSPQGYPLRWQVIPGNTADPPAMLQLLQQARDLPWLKDVPVVMDRAMGSTAYLQQLGRIDWPFVTALTATEFETYAPQLTAIGSALNHLTVHSESELEHCAKQAAEVVQAHGMKLVDDTLLLLDLDTVKCPRPAQKHELDDDRVQRALQIAQSVQDALDSGQFTTAAAAAHHLGKTKDAVRWYRKLLRLPSDVQDRILAGEAKGRSLSELLTLIKLSSAEQQRTAFDELLMQPRNAPGPPAPEAVEEPALEEVRCGAYFNPQLFARKRLAATQKIKEVELFVKQLNQQAARATSAQTAESLCAKVKDKLRHLNLISAFDVSTSECESHGRRRPQVEAQLNSRAWSERRLRDGFSVVVAHPSLTSTAESLCRTYRSKDAVETDFRIIKSVTDIRPMWHHTANKVRAHVTLCMLGLLAQRTLQARLAKHSGAQPELALQTLEPCRLNAYAGSRPMYLLTTPDSAQNKLLRQLRLSHLVDEPAVAGQLTPRASFVTTRRNKTA